jgi:hypothetical protein
MLCNLSTFLFLLMLKKIFGWMSRACFLVFKSGNVQFLQNQLATIENMDAIGRDFSISYL